MTIRKEVRSFKCDIISDIETREVDGKQVEQRKMVGHAALFNEETRIGNQMREQIAPGAFANAADDDVRALFNHNPDYVLGRNKSGTLKLSEDDKGLLVEIDPPDTQFARDLQTSIDRGDISQMSFAFQVTEDAWDEGRDGELDLRTIKKVRLFDVSPVTFPAYEGTDIAVRSHEAWKEQNKTEDDAVVTTNSNRKRLLLNKQ